MNAIRNLPLIIKVPIFLASFLTLILGFVTIFENLPESAGAPLQCKMKFSGPVKIGESGVGLLTHLYRDQDGRYVVAGLDKDKNVWLSGKMGFGANMQPYWELINRRASSLKNSGTKDLTLSASFNEWAFVSDDQGRRMAINVDKDVVREKSSLGLCTGSWDYEANMSRVNQNHLVVWNSLGQVGFYDLRRLADYIPKGVARSPDTLMVVDSAGSLDVGQCNNLRENRQSRVQVDDGLLAFSSGINGNISLYKVGKKEIALEPVPISFERGLNDFIMSNLNIFGVKVSGWLDRTEQWKIYRLSDLVNDNKEAKSVLTAKPLQFQRQYSLAAEEGSGASYWLTEQYKSHVFFDRYLISSVNAESGSKQSFEISDSIVEAALQQKSHWVVLPDNRHLFVANVHGSTQYSLIECGK